MIHVKQLLSLAFGLIMFLAVTSAAPTEVSSPNGKIKFKVFLVDNQLTYSVTMNSKPVIEASPMVMLIDSTDITKGVKLGKSSGYKVNETYPWNGLHSTAINRSNGMKINVGHTKSKTNYTLDIQVFDDAASFRFIVPGADNVKRAPDELTTFSIPAGSTVWYHDLYMHYEGVHAKKNIDTVPANQWAAPPVTIKLPQGGYASITEADLKDYAGMALLTNGKRGFTLKLAHAQPASYPYVLRYSKEDVEKRSKIAYITGTITTPWRVITVAEDLNTLVNCDAIHNLCPSPDKNIFPQGIRTDWVKPGRAVWKYVDGGGESTPENLKNFSKWAGQLGFEYNVLEGFWYRWGADTLQDVVNYSKEQGVGLFVWRHSRNLWDPKVRHELFKRCHDVGIKGLKIDFFDHEAKDVIDLYTTIFKETAEQKLLLILHGANKPTGLGRTWPNVMIYEAVKGMETSRISDKATHEATVPFTRNLAGPADYTVVHFGERRKNTTWAHQVATAAIYSAPVVTYTAHPETMLNNPCSDMIKSIPAVWDETKVLPPSEIGEIAIYAQRKGSTWFLSVINSKEPKSVSIPLSFLGQKNYSASLVKDKKDDTAAVEIETKDFKATDSITLELGEGGGFIGRFTEK